jgi:hypothetical protein
MTSRSAKYNKILRVEKNNSIPVGFENAYRYSMFNADENIYNRVNYPMESLKDLLKNAPLASVCVTTRMEASVGKGFSTKADPEKNLIATDKFIIDNWDANVFRNSEIDFISYGECFWELALYGNEVLTGYHVPAPTMLKGKGANEGVYYQNYKTKKEKRWRAFDEDLFKKGRHPNGNFILHIKRGYEDYGVPEWISASTILKILKEQYRVILSHFENDAEPERIFIAYGQQASKEQQKEFKNQREEMYQGSEKRGKSEWILSQQPKSQSGEVLDMLELKKEVINAQGLELALRNKFDAVSMFRVPHFLVGLNKPGELGSGGQAELLIWNYINNVIMPDQRKYYEPFNLFYPAMPFQFNTMEMPKLSQDVNPNNSVNDTVKSIMQGITETVSKTEYQLKDYEEFLTFKKGV